MLPPFLTKLEGSQHPMEPHLYAFLGGVAASGARYQITVVTTATGFRAEAMSGASATAWSSPRTLAEGPDLAPVLARAISTFVTKTKAGRDRSYTRSLVDGQDAGPFPKGPHLAEHPLCWIVGRSLHLLPPALRAQAIGADNPPQTALPMPDTPAPVAILPAPVATLPPRVGHAVMLCETIPNAEALNALIASPAWGMTEKLEGDRAQVHRLMDGSVCMTSRSGEYVNCPLHIAQAMQELLPGISLDGELLTVDAHGQAQLYVGAQATVQLFVAFDLLAHPSLPNTTEYPQWYRLATLADGLPPFQPPFDEHSPPIQGVAMAVQPEAKQQLLAEIRQRQGEGVVMRLLDAPYEGRRSPNWRRFCDRERHLDGVVLGYKAGIGTIAGMVGGIEVGLYDEAGRLRSIGWVGSGWTHAQRAELQARWDAGATGYVVTVKSYGLTFADQVIRPSGVCIRATTDKQPHECTFLSEVGRPPRTSNAA
ncbi:MAG: hypothetical protein EI684_02985 [Candidatus Viridilinea halotolerans]|uniref:ATP-dependent DNA ligase family profile domain-containing protein n=1 Tax=Candidatus Viridilinea halotolerans TaxID=2491704 RepID=A0A426U8G2_9CHLR|nr:MAG: hypothetical protein EI684_02985 [Candidatus Viridilinea halotolerans]